ncbi:hypothetical protein ABFX02_10G095800 [Erythranthe guttata]
MVWKNLRQVQPYQCFTLDTTSPAVFFRLSHGASKRKGSFPMERQYSRGNKLRSRSSVNKHKRLDAVFYKSRVGIYSNQSLIRGIRQVKKADFILHNTVYELESQTLSALSKYQPNYAIGPIRFSKNVPTNDVSKSFWSESDCTNWLDSKSPGSVLYVSFGSSVQTNKQVTEEVAYGLLLSEVNFIWVIRPGILGSPDNNVLPFGFEDEINIKDKGLIIPWCDQIKVLSNPVIGGFLTHCGWNSTLESMWCGVPMICYPIDWDQPTNRKLVVDDWKIGINLCDYGTSVDRKQVAEKIKQLMSGNSSKSLRQEADNVKAILQKAVEIDGSSEKNFDRFIEDLRGKIHETA